MNNRNFVTPSFPFDCFVKFGQLVSIFWANGSPPPLAKKCPYAYAVEYHHEWKPPHHPSSTFCTKNDRSCPRIHKVSKTHYIRNFTKCKKIDPGAKPWWHVVCQRMWFFGWLTNSELSWNPSHDKLLCSTIVNGATEMSEWGQYKNTCFCLKRNKDDRSKIGMKSPLTWFTLTSGNLIGRL